MLGKGIKLFVVAIVAFLTIAAVPQVIVAGGPYKFMVNYQFSMGGESAATVDALFSGLAEVVKQKTGIEVEMLSAETADEVYEKLKNGEIDLAILKPMQYIRAVEEKFPVRPMLSLAFSGKVTTNICLYVRKDSDEAGGLGSLRDKRLMILSDKEWLYTQNFLKKNGFDGKLTEYFSKVLEANNPSSALYTLIFKKTDVLALSEMAYVMAAVSDKRFNDIQKLECMGEYPIDPLVFNENFDWKDAITITKTLLKAHKDPAFKEFRVYFIAGNAKFEKVTPEVYEPFRKRVEAARKAGWLKDYEKWKKTIEE